MHPLRFCGVSSFSSLFFKFIYYPDNAIFHNWDVEVEQQSQGETCQSKVGQQLSLMYWLYMLTGLQLQYNLIVNQNIQSVAAVKPDILVCYRQRLLPFKINSSKLKFMAKAFFIC